MRRPPSDEPRMEWAAGAGLWVTHSRCRHLLAGFHASARATWGWAGRGWGQTLCTPQLELHNQARAGLQELRVPPPLASPRTKFLMLTLSLCTLISKMGFVNPTCPFPTLPGDCKQGEASKAGHKYFLETAPVPQPSLIIFNDISLTSKLTLVAKELKIWFSGK